MKKRIIAATLISTGILLGCGGGNSTTTATPLTSATEAPVANASTGTQTAQSGSPTELASSVPVNGYSSLSIAATTTTGVQTASIADRLQSMLASLFIKPAYAQTANRCTTDAYKLVGIKEDGTAEPLSVTTSGTDSCNVGFREMFDLGSYILLTGEGIYKDDQTCNLVFLDKQSGALYCVGETLPSRYRIATAASSNSCSSPASMTCSNSEKVQTVLDTDGVTTKYALVNAQSTTFDSNNQISGLKTKLLRFDLTDTTNGPKAAVLLEGYQQGWSNYTTASEFEYFNLGNYRIAQNGDVLAAYQRSFWSNYTSGASGAYRSNLKYYYDFTNGGADFSSGNLREEESLPIFNAALSALSNSSPTGTVTGNTTASAQSVTSLSQISCMFDAPNSEGGILVTLPSSSWISGYDPVNNTSYSQWGSSSSLFRVTAPTSASAGKPVVSFVKPTLLCSTSNGASMYSGGDNAPQKIGNAWYTLQTAGAYSYSWNNGNPQYSYNTRTSVIGNSLSSTTNNVNDDTVFVIPTASSDVNNGGYYMGAGMNGTKIRASKDYIYLMNQGMTVAGSSSTGMEVSRFKPSEQTSGNLITNLLRIVTESRKLSITALNTNKKGNDVDLVARDLSSDDIDKVYGTIAEDGSYSQRTINNSRYSTIAVARLN